MGEKKLNLSAPLLSVRRFGSALASRDNVKRQLSGGPLPRGRCNGSLHEQDVSLVQVTEPVAVPFVWEEIPGKVRDRMEADTRSYEDGASITPRFSPRGALDVVKYTSDKQFESEIEAGPLTETHSKSDDVKGTDSSRGGKMEKWALGSDSGEDGCTNGLDVVTSADSQSVSCSVGAPSGSGGSVVNQSETFPMDQKTHDFLMSRSLPNTKVMGLEPPQYAPKKQNMSFDPLKEVEKIVLKQQKIAINQSQSFTVPHYDQDADEEDTVSKVREYIDANNMSDVPYGLVPQLDSMSLVNPVPELKDRSLSLPSSTCAVGEPRMTITTASHFKFAKKYAWDAPYNKKSDDRVNLLQLPDFGNKLLSNGEGSDQLSSDRFPQNDPFSPYKRPQLQSPFSGGGFLGFPKEAENSKASMSNNNRNYSKSRELSSYQYNQQSSGSSSAATEKILCVDTVPRRATSSPDASGSPMVFPGKYRDTSEALRSLEESTSLDYSNASMEVEAEVDQDPSATLAADGAVESNDNLDGPLLLPPPLPKTPAESWLQRALPSVTTRNSLPRSRFQPKKEEVQMDNRNSKWETIVKTSHLRRDHVLYSEELIGHVARQPSI